jgi:aspartate aminotransferase-like enzyme
VAEVVARHGRRLLIDAMSAFGALPLDAGRISFDAVVASSNKCLEGVPGMGFCIARRPALEAARAEIRRVSPAFDGDRPFYRDIAAIDRLIEAGALQQAN